jgi:hypothetical protein
LVKGGDFYLPKADGGCCEGRALIQIADIASFIDGQSDLPPLFWIESWI